MTYDVSVSLSHLYNPKYENVELFRTFRKLAEIKYLNEVESNKTNLSDHVTIADPPEMLNESLIFRSVHFICDRGVSHELVRHRCAVAQESTRYCNYSSDKFGSEIRVVVPSTFADWDESSRACWTAATNASEQCYLAMIENGRKPQEARSVLNNSLATQVVLSMTPDRWEHFFDLRSRGTTGAPHPDMKVVADIALEKYNNFLNK